MSEPRRDLLELECRDVLTEISSFIDDDVSEGVSRAIREHLEHCRTCRVLIDSTRRSITILGDAARVEIPDALSRKIMDKLKGGGAPEGGI